MITPLEIENKRFSKKVMNGYDTDEVDDFLDEITADYEKLYKEHNSSKDRIDEYEKELEHYKNIENTLNNTLVLAQQAAEEVKKVAEKQAEQIIEAAKSDAEKSLTDVETQIKMARKELEDVKKEFSVYKAKMESLLISQLEILKEINPEYEK